MVLCTPRCSPFGGSKQSVFPFTVFPSSDTAGSDSFRGSEFEEGT